MLPPNWMFNCQTSLRQDNETTSKVTQTVAEFEFNGKKIKLHLYHTNQSGLIQGSNHDMFYKQFFLPMIEEINQLHNDKIRRFNQLIISTIMPATNLLAHKMGRAGAKQCPPGAPQGISQDSLGLPSLGNKSVLQPTLEEETTLSSPGLEGQVTSTPNPSPVSSPTRMQSVILLSPPIPAPAPASAPPVPAPVLLITSRRAFRRPKLQSLCWGAHGEGSPGVHTLVVILAACRIRTMTMQGKNPSPHQLGLEVGTIRKRLSLAAVRANSTLLLQRAGPIGDCGGPRTAACQPYS